MRKFGKRKTSNLITILNDNKMKVAKKSEGPVHDMAYQEAITENPDASIKKQFAIGFAKFLDRKAILIQREDYIAGYLYKYVYNVNFPMKTNPDFDPTKKMAYQMDPRREAKEVRETIEGLTKEQYEELDRFADGVEAQMFKHWHSGHFSLGFQILLDKGFGGLIDDVAAEMENTQNAGEKDCLESFMIVLNACVNYIERYEKMAECLIESAQNADELIRLGRMYFALRHIKYHRPQTFFQAIQLIWLAYEMSHCESVPSSISIGRLDYILTPYYEKDIKEGKITYEEAGNLIDAFFVKCSTTMGAFQNLTLGGCDENGKNSVNDLTYLCLEAVKNLKFDQPSVTFRWTEDMREETWQAVLDVIREGMGFPALLYDPCCIKARKKAGISEKDSWNYSIVGCVEFTVQGEEYCLTEICRLNLPKVLNLMFAGGKDLITGKNFPLRNYYALSEITSYEMLVEWYLNEVEKFVELGIHSAYRLEQLYEKKYPLPYLSVLTNSCIEKKKDVSEGGAKYNNVAFNLCGVATITDSLMAIKKVVFDEKIVSLEKFVQILENNFEGEPRIYNIVKNQCPKYGNDLEEPDMTAVKIIQRVEEKIKCYKTYHGGCYRLGLYSVEDHSKMGKLTGATADGRLAGTALSNSSGAAHGADKEGPTALINSVNRFKMENALNGMVLDIKFIPSFLESETGQRALKNLITTYFHQGGMEIQVSVVSKEILLAAQKEPDKYRNLIVRVSGFSAYFTTLCKETQDEIINRTEYGR